MSKHRRHYAFVIKADLAEEWSEFLNGFDGESLNEKFNNFIRQPVHKPNKEEWLKSIRESKACMHKCTR